MNYSYILGTILILPTCHKYIKEDLSEVNSYIVNDINGIKARNSICMIDISVTNRL